MTFSEKTVGDGPLPAGSPAVSPTENRPRSRLLSLSLDLDNLWSYMKTHGDPGWEDFPSYLEALVEILLDRLRSHGLTLTVFVVGQDAALQKNHGALRALAEAGHEIANHSFRHEPWLGLFSRGEIENEIETAESHIERATGRRAIGFRGPGYCLTEETLRVLARRGYLYDASTFPTFLGPLARAYYFWKSRGLSAAERKKRSELFGGVRDGLRPLRPYFWEVEDRRLVEIPVTTMPFLRVPFHMSYLLYIARFAGSLSLAYLETALTLCRWTAIQPSFLLHPLDFLGCDQVRELAFFPGMDLTTERKLRTFDRTVAILKRHFDPVPLSEHARSVIDRGGVPARRFRP